MAGEARYPGANTLVSPKIFKPIFFVQVLSLATINDIDVANSEMGPQLLDERRTARLRDM